MIAKPITYALLGGLMIAGMAHAAEPKAEMEKLPEALPMAAQVPVQLPDVSVPDVSGMPSNDAALSQQQAAMALIYLLMSSQVNPAQLLR